MASHKIQKANAAPADETELAVAQALVDLESSVPELRALAISSAKEVWIAYTCRHVE
jgi:small subunit ribosomal protein S7e